MNKRKYPIYEELQEAFEFYNRELFKSLLPECIIVLNKKWNILGHFRPNGFVSNDEKEEIKHEIAMNVEMFALRSIELTLSTLVHEMCHLKTYIDGFYGRGAYHNKEWANEMKSVGLIPSTSGEAGGKETGQSVSHYIDEGGLFAKKTRELIGKGFLITFVEKLKRNIKSYTLPEIEGKVIEGKPGYYKGDDGKEFKGKVIRFGKDDEGKEIVNVIVKKESSWKKYSCKCGNMVMGRGGLEITCNKCKEMFEEKYKNENEEEGYGEGGDDNEI